MKDMNYISEQKEYKNKNIIRKVIFYTILSIWGLIVLFPFYYMVLTSLKSYSLYVNESTPSFIFSPSFDNYITAFSKVKLMRYFLNTILFSIVTTLLMLIITVFSAFAFSRLNFVGKELVFTIFLALMMIPTELVVITNYRNMTLLNLRNTYTGLILPSVASIFYIYLLKENFQSIPDSLYFAAKMDGTSDMKYLFKVMIPICKPTIVSIIILKIIECWNSYIWPRLITTSEDYYLLSNGIQEIRQSGFGKENVPAMMAAVVVVSLPLIIIFLIFRKEIMNGVSKSGTKG